MLAHGNGKATICARNLLNIHRGEVPYDRIKGVDLANIDGPAPLATADITEDAKWMLGVYEPRASVESVEMIPDDLHEGSFVLSAKINTTGGAPNE